MKNSPKTVGGYYELHRNDCIFQDEEGVLHRSHYIQTEKDVRISGSKFIIESFIPRKWDIILTCDENMQFAMKKAIENFQYKFTSSLLDADIEILDFSYGTYLNDKVLEFDCENAENYLSFYEGNAFVEKECRRYLESLTV